MEMVTPWVEQGDTRVTTPKSHSLWDAYSPNNPLCWKACFLLFSSLLLNSKYEPLGFWHLHLYVTFTVWDLSVPLQPWLQRQDISNISFCGASSSHRGHPLLAQKRMIGLAHEMSGCLLSCRGDLCPTALQTLRGCAAVWFHSVFSCLSPFNIPSSRHWQILLSS